MLRVMYRISLSAEQRQALHEQSRQRGLVPSTRDRLEMVRLSDAGWSVPRIARHLGLHEQTVRAWVKAFLGGGLEAMADKPRGGKSSAVTPQILELVRQEIAQGQRIWTAGQVADWVAQQHGVRLSARRLRDHLQRAGLSWQRTSRSIGHKQDAHEVAAKRLTLEMLKKGRSRTD